MTKSFKKSEELLKRALKVIPLGTQTFSKSLVQFPHGVSPYYVSRGQGSHIWDVDGNEYIDFVNSLLSVTLGYNDADVNQAVAEQLNKGSIFSLPHELEILVSEKLVEMVPCAEMVRFGKNGSDATSGAIRVARAYTGRDHVAVCGYHGWQDWYIGSTARHLGVPQGVRDLTHTFVYNQIKSLEEVFAKYPGKIAAVIMEPMNTTFPEKGFLENVKKLTQAHGAVLIFDEMITGFRFARGGAQEYFGVTPDLATFGKGLANGYALSAVVGKKEIMKLMEDIFFSFTFGGETLSLAAALATLTKLQTHPVIETLVKNGERVMTGIQSIIEKHKLQNIFETKGHPAWSFLVIKDVAPYSQWQIKTLYMQEVLERGILSFGTHNMSYAHTEADIQKLLGVYQEVLPRVGEAVVKKELEQKLRCEPLQPLFKVR